jgi:hypothetical protein
MVYKPEMYESFGSTFILMKNFSPRVGRPKSEEKIPKISNCYSFLFLHWVFYLFLLRSPFFRLLTSFLIFH